MLPQATDPLDAVPPPTPPRDFRTPFSPLASDGEPVGLTTEELMTWQDEQRQRRMMGEYQRSSRMLSSLIEDNFDTPMTLSALRVTGTVQTRASFLAALLKPSLASTPETLGDLLKLTQATQRALAPWGIFKQIDVRLETPQSLLAEKGAVDLVVDVKESGRLMLKSGTEVGQGEGSAYITGNVKNVFGGAETLSVSSSLGTKTRSATEVSLRTPLVASPLHSLSLTGFSLDRDNTTFASHWEGLKGGRLSYETTRSWGSHSLSYEAINRSLHSLTPEASLSVREAARPGPSLKSAVVHTFLRDTRDRQFLGSRGSFWKATQEVAGLGGDAKHLKSVTETSFSRYLGSGHFASLTARTGLVVPLDPTKGVWFGDRLFSGGSTSVRGWRMNALGPRDAQDSLGGNLTYALGASLFSPLPGKPEWPLKVHTFCNVGSLASLPLSSAHAKKADAPSTTDVKQALSELGRPSVSVGAGLVYEFAPIRIELGFTLPLVAREGEGVSKGWGLGMGMEFL